MPANRGQAVHMAQLYWLHSSRALTGPQQATLLACMHAFRMATAADGLHTLLICPHLA